MRPTTRPVPAVLAACLAATALAAAPSGPLVPGQAVDLAGATATDPDDPATYGADHLVVAGARDPGASPDGARFEYLAYYPEVLQVHRGDVVQFRLDQFHTVTFTAAGQPRRGLYRTDEAGGVIQSDGALPFPEDCGSLDQPACVFDDPEAFVNSGWNLETDALAGSLRMEFDVPEGSYTYYCTVHPGMEGTVQVVPDEVEVATPDDLLAQRYDRIAADTAAGEARKANPPQVPGPQVVDGRRRWSVQVGATTPDHRVAVLQFFPSALAIEPGDEVRFFVPDGGQPPPGQLEPGFEGHTVGIEPPAVRENDPSNPFLRYLVGMCDPDELDGGLPGYVDPASFILGCPDPEHRVEVAWNPSAFRHPRDVDWDDVPPGTYFDSGLMGPPDTPCRLACNPYDPEQTLLSAEVTARFPTTGDIGYRCFLHGAMDGTISIRG